MRSGVLTSSSYIVIRKCYTERRAHNTIISSAIRPFRASVAQTLRIFPNKLAFLSALVLFAACVVGEREGVRASVYIAARQSLQSILSSPAAVLIGLSELIGSKMQLRQPCVEQRNSGLHLPCGSLKLCNGVSTLRGFQLQCNNGI